MNVIDILEAAIFTPFKESPEGVTTWGLPLCLYGPPGYGKTHRIEALYRSYGLPLEVLSPGERGEGAYGVTPVPQKNLITYPAPDWVVEIHDGGGVFLDEINTAPPPLQPAQMAIVLARRVGGHKLGPRVRVIAAANKTEESAGGWDLAPPLANRMGHLDWPEPTAHEWGNWLLGATDQDKAKSAAVAKEEAVLAKWGEFWSTSRGLAAGFTRARPELLHKMPKLGSPDIARAWPSPRTWEMATRAYCSGKVHSLKQEELETFVSAFVGRGVGSEFFNYIAKLDLPNPIDVLDGKVKFKHQPKRLDRTAAILGSCFATVSDPKAEKRDERAGKLWEILGDKELSEDAMDIGFSVVVGMVRSNLHTQKPAHVVLAKMLPMLQAAGVKFEESRSR